MQLLTPSEKLLILESKCLPKKEAERIADLLRNKFRFSINRPNSKLISTYLEKIVVEKDGKVDRAQEYVRRIAKLLDNANTELVAAEIEKGLSSSGVYEFAIPKDLLSKAKELAAMVVDSGFSYKEFASWLEGAKSYKTDAEAIMAASDMDDLEALYVELLSQANESTNESSMDGFDTINRPEENIDAFKKFEELQKHLEDNYDAGTDYHITADGSIKISPDVDDEGLSALLDELVEYVINEAKMTIKRPYKRGGVELRPAVTVQEEAAVRNKIVKFLGEQVLYRVSKSDLNDFFNSLNEDVEIGRRPSNSWLYRNKHLVKRIKVGKEQYFKLTRAGVNLFNQIKDQINEVADEVEDTDAIVKEFLNEKSKLAQSIKGMPVNNKTEPILTKLHNLADEKGHLSEQLVYDALSEDEKEYLEEVSESVDEAFSIKSLLDVEEVKKRIAETPETETTILIPNYSILVQSKYENGEDLENDLEDLEKEIGHSLSVNSYDDLIADPHGIMSE